MNFYYPKKVIFSGRVVHNPYLCSIGSCIIKIKKKTLKLVYLSSTIHKKHLDIIL